ncbi:MAG: hypothetical protein COB78_06370 [Hyphomicrobiales bacterium]|nr:MAG: hypothetical protein COB78_06370 [Hyphomicrobiales bacterium]
MKIKQFIAALAYATALLFSAYAVQAANFPDPVEGDFIIKKFDFHTGESITDMKVHYYTVGDPANEAVLLLHGTTGSGKSMLRAGFSAAMFGPGQPLDASKYYLIMPDAIGAGGTAKPSNGLRAKFPRYNYDDMVDAQYQLVTQGLGVKHLRLVMGNSMGGMHVWTWATRYPDFADAAIPMASLPAPMAGRNWMMRKMLIDSVRNDPLWDNGNYTTQPPNLRIAKVWFSLGTYGGNMNLQAKGATNKQASAYVDAKVANQKAQDANDEMYQWDSSRDFDPRADLHKITAYVLVINSQDDERNPTELKMLEAYMPAIAHGQVYIIPESPTTTGHGTTGGQSALYAEQVGGFLAIVPKK